MVAVSAEEIEERPGIPGAAEHGVEEDDVEGLVGLCFQPRAMIGLDDLDEAARVASMLGESFQGRLREGRDDGVGFEAENPDSGRVSGDEGVAAEAQGSVEDCLAGLEARVCDERDDLALAHAEHAQEGDADGGAVHAAAVVEVRPARAENEHGGACGLFDELFERPSLAWLCPHAEAGGEVLRLCWIAARGGGHDGAGLDWPLAAREA